jgi:hypothetical protein
LAFDAASASNPAVANVDPYRLYRPFQLRIHVCAPGGQSGELVTVRNYDLPSPELARLRFEVARVACEQPSGGEVTVELISGGSIVDSFVPCVAPRWHHWATSSIRRRRQYRAATTGRLIDGVERELGGAATIEDAVRLHDKQASLYLGGASWCYAEVSLCALARYAAATASHAIL